jgi:hypothetical protein
VPLKCQDRPTYGGCQAEVWFISPNVIDNSGCRSSRLGTKFTATSVNPIPSATLDQSRLSRYNFRVVRRISMNNFRFVLGPMQRLCCIHPKNAFAPLAQSAEQVTLNQSRCEGSDGALPNTIRNENAGYLTTDRRSYAGGNPPSTWFAAG